MSSDFLRSYFCGSVRAVALMLASVFATTALHAQISPISNGQRAANLAWSQRMVDSMMTRYPNPTKLGVWGYQRGLYLFGQYLVYRRTHDPRYLKYIETWVNTHIDVEGHPDQKINSLDSIMAANLLVVLYQETHEQRYKLGADYFRSRFDDYPRTTDGGFWHATVPSRRWQLWLDGTYMAEPFLLRYGQAFRDSKYTDQEVVRQLLVYHKHLKAAHSGLLYHAYDESGKSKWIEPGTHHSRYFWCRSIGWYGMTLVDTLDVIPQSQPGRAQLIHILRALVKSLAQTQDSKTGLWYQITNKPNLPGNWTETSSSAMFTYIIDVAVKRGYVSQKYHAVAAKGYRGVLSRVSLGPDGLTNITGICEGTNVGNLQYYLHRKRRTNDFHGLGAFLIMNEEWNTSVASQRLNPQVNSIRRGGAAKLRTYDPRIGGLTSKTDQNGQTTYYESYDAFGRPGRSITLTTARRPSLYSNTAQRVQVSEWPARTRIPKRNMTATGVSSESLLRIASRVPGTRPTPVITRLGRSISSSPLIKGLDSDKARCTRFVCLGCTCQHYGRLAWRWRFHQLRLQRHNRGLRNFLEQQHARFRFANELQEGYRRNRLHTIIPTIWQITPQRSLKEPKLASSRRIS